MSRILAIALLALTLTGAGGARAATAISPAHARCGGNLLTWFPPQGNGYAGGAGYVVEFSNIGRLACSVKGYPTVKLTENGRRVGLKSRHDPLVPVRRVTLRPGQTAHVVLFITDAGVLCRPSPTNGLSVRPPGSARVARFPLVAFGACPGKSTLRVDAINPGVGIPFYTIR
jgi:hypothetical protein